MRVITFTKTSSAGRKMTLTSKATIFNGRQDGSVDVVFSPAVELVPFSFVNDCASGCHRFLNLSADGTVRYFFEYYGFSREVQLMQVSTMKPLQWRSWFVPSWTVNFHQEARAAALAFLLFWKKNKRSVFKYVVRDVALVIARMVYGSSRDSAWLAVTNVTHKSPAKKLKSNE